ncbi:MAG: FapA family protein [Anaerovibrio sp.]|nr:FapA family protein [Anaerovibrio sp.]
MSEAELEAKRVYGKVFVDVSKDKMEVMVRFDVKDNETIPNESMIKEALSQKNIVFGIDEEAIKEAAASGRLTKVARGVPPENGLDAQVSRKFDAGIMGRPVVDEYDRVDYKNLNIFCLARKGQILAERIPHTTGTPGTNVHGNPVRQKPGKPKPLPNGKNTVVKDENFVVAEIDGQIVDTGSKISVDPHLDIKGDVGMATGNIDFIGGVTVNGSVQAGFILKATGDIEIKGMISGGDVTGRNVFVGGGVQGMNRGVVRASDDFHAVFVENADIEAGGNVIISDVAMHSTIRAGHTLAVEGRRGLVNGGFLAAGEEVRANTIGNTMNVATRITVGVNPMLQKKYQTVLKEYNEAKKRLDQVMKMVNTLGKIDISQMPPDKAERIHALVQSQFPLAGIVERNERTLKELDTELQKMKRGRVRVKDIMYPGVKLSINSIMKNVQVEESHCTQYVEDDFIKIGAY